MVDALPRQKECEVEINEQIAVSVCIGVRRELGKNVKEYLAHMKTKKRRLHWKVKRRMSELRDRIKGLVRFIDLMDQQLPFTLKLKKWDREKEFIAAILKMRHNE